jgi:CDP-diglyceride synthetase
MELLAEPFFWKIIIFLWLPLIAADNGGGVAKLLHAPLCDTTVSFRYLGPNKTVAAYYVGPVLAFIVLYAEYLLVDGDVSLGQKISIATIVGIAVVSGDHIKSFIKRRLGISPGAPWVPWDQIDYAIGGCLGYHIAWSYFDYEWELWNYEWLVFLSIAVLAAITKPIGNYLSFLAGLRRDRW